AARESAERAAADLATYFEVRTSGLPRIAIGFALSRDPAEDVDDRLTLDDLADVELHGTVVCGSGSLAVPAFSRLAPGAVIALDTPLGGHGLLRFGGVAFARGTCGIRNGRSSFDVARAAGPGSGTAA
ncbi:MAG: FliM/FliN family flagellar motor switch protein, partial [Candidatus Eremiobacteraeota bacterium]|nr:FliM/FliN family flagellar motor switch protein [Candidatus Eremiobacteraeota bacterium]